MRGVLVVVVVAALAVIGVHALHGRHHAFGRWLTAIHGGH
jgi:hypothetical protein